MNLPAWLGLVLIAALVAASLFLYAHLARRWGLLAVANADRHLHRGQVPTGAGLAFLWPLLLLLFLWLLGVLESPQGFLPGVDKVSVNRILTITTVGLLAMLVTGYLDDRYQVSARWRLLLQVVLVSAVLLLMWPLLHRAGFPLWWLPIFFFGALWWLNLFNFMDGANGMAAWHVVVSASIYALVFYLNGAFQLAFLAASTALVSAIFLYWNFPQARLFMGDAGSLGLAWLILVLALAGLLTGVFDPVFVLLLHLPFVLDSTLTLYRRWRAGQRLTEAHRQHLYQRLIAGGQSHARVSLAYALASLFGGVLALISQALPAWSRWLVLLSWLAVLLVVGSFLNRATKTKPTA